MTGLWQFTTVPKAMSHLWLVGLYVHLFQGHKPAPTTAQGKQLPTVLGNRQILSPGDLRTGGECTPTLEPSRTPVEWLLGTMVSGENSLFFNLVLGLKMVYCQFHWMIMFHTWWLIPLSKWVITPVISGLTLVIHSYPIYNWGYNPLTKWDEPPSIRWSIFSRWSCSAQLD